MTTVMPARSAISNIIPSWEAGAYSSTSVPLSLLVIPVSPLASSTKSAISNEAVPSIKTTSSSGTISASASTTEARTPTLTVATPSSHTKLSSTSTTSSSDNQITLVVPTIASEPNTDNTKNKINSTLAIRLGLGLGIPLLVLLVVAVTACIYRRQRGRSYTEKPPTRHNVPELPQVSEADIAYRGGASQQHHHHGPPRNMSWPGWDPAGVSDEGIYDDNQMGYVSPLESQRYHRGHQVPWEGYEVYSGSPNWYLYPYQYQYQGYQGHGGTGPVFSPYENQEHMFQVPHVVQVPVQQPQEAPQNDQQHSAQDGSGPDTGIGEGGTTSLIEN
ncbi:hypothetical protein VPNG_06774 [Cytospora leucostoma]|uniref:Mid2 domain-containing protein n=1 Tax=Cytospora leucostoma TaxID=1230097 RepID=A0A423WT47_9PEZI|nr:hypothetical protein VPNG_06774 [Cytospora leucostoma]